MSKDETFVRIPKVKSFRERILRAICKFPGPAISIRDLQKHVRGSLADNIKCEYRLACAGHDVVM